jgi:hypothetical protein
MSSAGIIDEADYALGKVGDLLWRSFEALLPLRRPAKKRTRGLWRTQRQSGQLPVSCNPWQNS